MSGAEASLFARRDGAAVIVALALTVAVAWSPWPGPAAREAQPAPAPGTAFAVAKPDRGPVAAPPPLAPAGPAVGGEDADVLASGLPDDLHGLAIDDRKQMFVSTVLPIVRKVNRDILRTRDRLHAHFASQVGSPQTPDWLRRLERRYRVEGDAAELLARVDVLPPSLVLAQAAIESGWGRSRFAIGGNALFGQRAYGDEDGMRPFGIDDDAGFVVRTFDSLEGSVRAYALNLNTHPAYAALRAERARLRAAGDPVSGAALAGTLQLYSERGDAYVAELVAIIEGNRLQRFDAAAAERERTDAGAGVSRMASAEEAPVAARGRAESSGAHLGEVPDRGDFR